MPRSGRRLCQVGTGPGSAARSRASWSRRPACSSRWRFPSGSRGSSACESTASRATSSRRSGAAPTGPRTAALEARMRDSLEVRHVLAVSSATAALHLSLVALGVGPGDEVITSSITWPATANVIVHCGATPVFADVREDTLNIDPERAAELVGARTKAIVPVDLYGQPADLDPLLELGVPLVEDAAHAAEAVYRGRKIGS